MLDARLRQVAAFVRQGSRLADIGTDHAFLPVELVKSGRCTYAVASDVRVGPVAAATRTVSEAGLQDKIAIRLGDGLSTVSEDEVDDIVIAGMGGETIAMILAAALWVNNGRYRLILQPMTRAEKLRRYLWESGFAILAEEVVHDGRHWYTVIHTAYTGEICHPREVDCHIGKTRHAGYWENVKKRLQKQWTGTKDEAVHALLLELDERIKTYDSTSGT